MFFSVLNWKPLNMWPNICVMMLQFLCLLSLCINIIIPYFQLATWNRYLIFYYCMRVIQLAALLNFSIDVTR